MKLKAPLNEFDHADCSQNNSNKRFNDIFETS